MIRHRRYASLDSSSLLGLVPVRHAFTLQQSSNGPRTARLTAHTSPLALAPAISTPCSPQSDSETEMEEQLERMVSSVVNSPTTPSSAGFPSASQLGLGLPSTMQGQHRRALSSTSVGRSLLPARPSVEGDPKLNMGMRAAVGNYRKRVLTVQTTQPPPAVTISIASPTTEETQLSPDGSLNGSSGISPLSATSSSSSSLLTPPASPDASVPATVSRKAGHRRVVSAGALPSLDQIRQWSERRSVSCTPDAARQPVDRDEGFSESSLTSVEVLVPAQPTSAVSSAKKENRLDRILRARPLPAGRIKISVSVPTTPVVQLTREVEPLEKQREEKAKQMVNLLGKRRSLTALHGNA